MNDPPRFSPGGLDYLQRVGEGPVDSDESFASIPASSFAWLRLCGTATEDKGSVNEDLANRRALLEQRPQLDSFIAGLHDNGVPIAFCIDASPSRTELVIGTWSPEPREDAAPLFALESVMASSYPGLHTEPAAPPSLRSWDHGGVAVGVPPTQIRSSRDAALPIDRLQGALRGQVWGLVVIALPAPDEFAASLRDSVLNEMRITELAQAVQGSAVPAAAHYLELLKPLSLGLTEATATGLWRTAIFLCGTRASYPVLASTWKAVFAGSELRAEPVRVWEWNRAIDCVRDFVVPEQPGLSGPGSYSRPFHYQTMLASSQLAAYVHLPERETAGFAVSLAHRFDVVPNNPAAGTATIRLGSVISPHAHTSVEGARDGTPFEVSVDDLSRHAFITGVTGAGKTNTIFTLLRGASRANVPFLVLEPAKAEYRRLMGEPTLNEHLCIFTLGDESTTPMRLNPFEVIPGQGNSIASHLNMLRAVFTAAFGLWSPLPEIIEQALYRVYEQFGWNIADNVNPRVASDADRALAFPTLSAFCETVDELVLALGYDQHTTSDIRAALSTRLNSLRSGGKGRLLDTPRSTSITTLFEQNCILELERMGNEGDRSFVMGLLLIRLSEYRRQTGASDRLRHLVVLEEAHRLLARSNQPAAVGQASPTEHAVESFVNLLAEIRAYGEGVIVADQVPSRLAPEVTKNTNLKIVHRLVAEDDRAVVGATMVATPRQLVSIATLSRGVASVFCEGEDAPLLVQVDHTKDALTDPDDAAVINWMRRQHTADPPFRFPSCGEFCEQRSVECDAAQRMTFENPAQAAIERCIESVLELPDAASRLWPSVLSELRASSPFGQSPNRYLRCGVITVAWSWSARRGSERGWSFSATHKFATELVRIVLASLDTTPKASTETFRELSEQLHRRDQDPYPYCTVICGEVPTACRHRETAERQLALRANTDARSIPSGNPSDDWVTCKNIAASLIEWPPADSSDAEFHKIAPGARRMALCLGQTAIFRTAARTAAKLEQVEALLTEATGAGNSQA